MEDSRPYFARPCSYDSAALDAQVALMMVGYKPPEITAEMIGVYSGEDLDPLNLLGNPHRVTAAQISGFTSQGEEENGNG